MRRVAGAMIPLLVGCVWVDPSAAPAPPAGGQGEHKLTVQVRSIAGASGKLTANGADCSSGCVVSSATGASVTLASEDATLQGFAVDCPGAGCKRTSSRPLTVDLGSDHQVEATFRPAVNYVFVSSLGLGGAMGGLAGADAHCKGRAEQAGLGGTTYRAWLTATGRPALARLGSARGWIRTDGLPFADSPESIGREETFYPPRLDEFGADLAAGRPHGFIPVWSGTYPASPSFSGFTCNDWSSSTASGASVGNAASGVGWSFNAALYACEGWQLPVYCFQTDHSTPVTVPAPPPGSRIAYVAPGFSPVPGGSIVDADAKCMADAAAAGLSGRFKALIADIGKAAMDRARFDVEGAPWYRRDGVQIVRLASDYLTRGGPTLLAPIDLAADGRTRARPLSPAWTGFGGAADDYTVAGTAETTCKGWSSNAASDVGVTSIVDFTLKSFEKGPNWPIPSCDRAAALYCLQE